MTDDDIWTVKRILDWIEGYLAHHDDEKPRAAAQWLVAEALGVSRMQLFVDLDRPLTADERATLRDWTRRRATGEPLQYITGSVDFRHVTVKVRPGVLIPRPETEVLVSEALALLPHTRKPQDVFEEELIQRLTAAGEPAETQETTEHSDDLADRAHPGLSADSRHAEGFADQLHPEFPADPGNSGNLAVGALSERPGPQGPMHAAYQSGCAAPTPTPSQLLVADICTGSGCIACSIAYEHPQTRVVATDIAPDAIALAQENVAALGLEERVSMIECDLGEGIDPDLLGTFDLVVSNPPYVPSGVLAALPQEVTAHEPALALDGGADGLDVFRRLLDWCSIALAANGAFAFELHETCLDDAAAEADYAGFADVRIVRDLANRPRILTARKR